MIAGGEGLVRGASSIALRLGIPSIVVGLTIVAIGTSAPELAVSLKASLDGNTDIAIANIVGSNIFNVLFILGVSSLILPLIINIEVIRREIPVLIGVSVLLYAFLWDLKLSRIEGICLLVACAAYTFVLVRGALKERKKSSPEQVSKNFSLGKNLVFLLLGLVSVAYGAKFLVSGASELARSLGVSETIIGLTIVACGTSLPEVVASVMATIRGERDLAIGNVVGSNIYNILAIGGLSASIAPNTAGINPGLFAIDIPVMMGASLLCLPFFKSGKELSRVEGGCFVCAYISYLAWLIFSAS